MSTREDTTKPIVVFLGPVGSYTHQATLSRFEQSKLSLTPAKTISEVFAAVQQETTKKCYGVVPFENSSDGPVSFTLDLLEDADGQNADILVTGEISLAVHHCLLGHAASQQDSDKAKEHIAARVIDSSSSSSSRAEPSCDLSHIKKLYTHPQAWGQCTQFLDKLFPGVEREDASSTSAAAKLVAEDGTRTSAAIAARIAGELNHLDILAKDIEDRDDNTTRFLVLRRREQIRSNADPSAAPKDDHEAEELGRYKALIIFTAKYRTPDSLEQCCAVFDKHGLKHRTIRPQPNTAHWQYTRLVECTGTQRLDGQAGIVTDALEDLGKVAKSWRWLGNWEIR